MKSTINRLLRVALVTVGVLLLMLCFGFWLQQPEVLALWPWPDGRLSYIFIASILAAIAAPVIWMGLSGEPGAMRGGALDFSVTYLGLTGALLLAGDFITEWVSIPVYLTVFAGSLLFNLFLFWATRNLTLRDQRPVPALLQGSFLVFAVLLIGVGISLIMRLPWIFPWPLQAQSSVVFGCIFLGAAMYFIYGLMHPKWGNFKGQLLGFLAYDLVLLVPFIQHFHTVKPDHQLSLYVYTAVVVYSGLLCIYFLFIHPSTRLGTTIQHNAPEMSQP